jgi:hypothetical protein
LFHNIKPSEEKLLSWLEKNADVRKVKDVWNKEVWKEHFQTLDPKIIESVLNRFKQQESLRESGETNIIIGHEIFHALTKISLNEGNTEDNTPIV